MKIRHIDIVKIALYPSILNPLIWVLFTLHIIYMLFVSWWKTEVDYEDETKYLILKLDSDKWRRAKSDMLSLIVSVTINTFWWNRQRTIAYTKYIEEKYFPTYPNDDWTRDYYLELKHNNYLKVSGKLK